VARIFVYLAVIIAKKYVMFLCSEIYQ
jgi:hypothetical protein